MLVELIASYVFFLDIHSEIQNQVPFLHLEAWLNTPAAQPPEL